MYHLHIAHATFNMPPGATAILGTAMAAEEFAPSAIAPPALGETWAGQGGIYCGTWPAMNGLPARHLVFGLEETKLSYGAQGEDEPGAASRVDGRANTSALVASAHDHPAAQWCANYRGGGHHDFHLPSQADLFLASLCAPHAFQKQGWYLSSSQDSRYLAFVQDFEDGGSYWSDKDGEFRVRAVRWIHLDA